MTIIDAHQHFWRVGLNDCSWPGPDLPAIHRDFLPDDWRAATAGLGIGGSVLVQSQPSAADTQWLLEVAEHTPEVLGVVGWVDLLADDAPDQIATLARNPLLRGIRPMLQGLPDDAWILQDPVAPGLATMERLGLTFDALIYPRHLVAIEQVAMRYPDLTIVIDHGAKPPLADQQLSVWDAGMERIARQPNILCKWSGLATELGPDQALGELQPAMQRLLDLFGPRRLIWGSDWPVCTLRIELADWLDRCRALVPDAADRDAIFGANAIVGYRLHR